MPASYLELSPLNRFRPPLYKRPVFYVPVAIFVFLLLVAGIYVLVRRTQSRQPGRDLRFEQARADGIGERDRGPER